LSESSALGSSDTPSAAGSRNVLSAYAEFLVPLHDTLEMQLALRHERYNDAGNVTKPKVAVSWVPQEWFQLRGAYSEGFRAPNLAQTSTPFVSRSNTRFDPVTDRSYGVTERRAGNPNLEPENSENLSYGMVFTPIDNLMFTVDWWNIEQTDLVGIVNSATWLAYDAILRDQGSSAVEVVRGDDLEVLYIDNSYQNLGKREMSGIDFMVDYQLSTDLGKFKFTANAAKLNKFDQLADDISTFVLDDQASGNSVVQDIAIAGVGDLIRQNGRPEWRGFAALNWSKDQWLAGIRYNYVSDFVDTSTANREGEPLPIDEFTTLDAYLGFRFQTEQFGKSRVRFGVRNLTDEEPPIADESYGYFSNVHSNRGRYVYINLSSSF
jgi:outer membrane receptor protein involved in Fe transport